jgi:hypothetical protein
VIVQRISSRQTETPMFTAAVVSTGFFLMVGFVVKSVVDAFKHRETDRFDVEETIRDLEHERIRLMNPNYVRRFQSCQQ